MTTIYRGKEAVFGVQLTIDYVWRYSMTDTDTLSVEIADADGHKLYLAYSSEDVDADDKIITVRLLPEQTEVLTVGRGKIAAYLNDLVVVPPRPIHIKEAI